MSIIIGAITGTTTTTALYQKRITEDGSWLNWRKPDRSGGILNQRSTTQLASGQQIQPPQPGLFLLPLPFYLPPQPTEELFLEVMLILEVASSENWMDGQGWERATNCRGFITIRGGDLWAQSKFRVFLSPIWGRDSLTISAKGPSCSSIFKDSIVL